MTRAFLWRFRPVDAERRGRRWLDNACWMSCPNKSNWMLGSTCRADSGADVTTEAGSVAGSSKKDKNVFLFPSLCPYRQVEQSGGGEITPLHPSGAGAVVPVYTLPAKGSFFLTSAVVLPLQGNQQAGGIGIPKGRSRSISSYRCINHALGTSSPAAGDMNVPGSGSETQISDGEFIPVAPYIRTQVCAVLDPQVFGSHR